MQDYRHNKIFRAGLQSEDLDHKYAAVSAGDRHIVPDVERCARVHGYPRHRMS